MDTQSTQKNQKEKVYSPFRDAYQDIVSEYDQKFKNISHTTGLSELDKALSNFKDGALIAITGNICTGKTALAAGIAFHFGTAKNKKIFMASLGMTAKSLARRMMSMAGKVPFIKPCELDEDWQRLSNAIRILASNHNFEIFDDCFKLSEIHRNCLALQNQIRYGLIVIDSLDLIHNDNISHSRTENQIHTLRILKSIAIQVGAPVIVIIQTDSDSPASVQNLYASHVDHIIEIHRIKPELTTNSDRFVSAMSIYNRPNRKPNEINLSFSNSFLCFDTVVNME